MQKKTFYLLVLMEVLLIVTLAILAVLLLLPLLQTAMAGNTLLLAAGIACLLACPALLWRVAGRLRRETDRNTLLQTPQLRAISLGVLLIGLLLTAAGTRELDKRITREAAARYDKLHERLIAEVLRRFTLPEYGLRGAADAIAASDGTLLQATRFRRYFQEMDLKIAFPGVRGFGFIDVVPETALAAYANQQQQQSPRFVLRDLGPGPMHYIIRYIESHIENREAWGLDLAANPIASATLQQALHRGSSTMSGVLTFQRQGREHAGYLMVLPVFRHGSPVLPAQRPAALLGYMYCPVTLDELMQGIAEATEQQLDFELYDSPIPTPGNLVFDEDGHIASARQQQRSFTREQRLTIGGRTLTLRSSSSALFEASVQRTSVWVVGTMGLMMSLLAALSSWLLLRNQQRAEQLAASMTRDLALLAKVARHTTNAIIITDKDRRISWVNEGFTRLTGYTLDEVRGASPGQILQTGSTDPQTVRRIRTALAALQPFRGNILNRSKSGREYWVAMEIQPLLDEQQQLEGYMAIESDISLQVAIEADLHSALLEARTIRDIIQQHFIVSIADPEGRITSINQAFADVSGYSQQELLGKNHRLLNAGVHDTEFWRQMWHTLGSGQAWRGEVCNRRKDGSLYWVDSIIVPFMNTHGEIERYVSIRRDITASKKHEATLQEAKLQAEQANQAKSRFLANMSHEIRTPMNAILGLLQLLQHTGLAPEQQDYADKTEAAARSLLGLLNDILDFSKVEAGKMTLDQQPFSLEALMRNLSVILSATSLNRPLEIVFDMAPDLPDRLLGDAMRLQQVLTNLASNAIKFTEQGEVVVSIRQLAQDGQQLTLAFSVRDTGIGISRELHDKLFHSFSQAESSTTRRFGGTGLGLAISQRIVQLMGSKIELESQPGQGSCFSFTLTLPIVESAAASPQTPALHVLVIDDNAIAREAMQHMAHAQGWQSKTLDSGEAVRQLLQQMQGQPLPYQLALVDWQMPGMDGWATCRLLKAYAPELAVIMVTAHSHDMLASRPEADRQLLDGFLVKPLTAQMLQETAVRLMEKQSSSATVVQHEPAGQAALPADLPLAGLRLLLVEDNATNRLVAKGLLSKEGASIDVAENGALAVEAVRRMNPRYDAVLMDLQMPVMDGLSATQAIRDTLGEHTLPIIAMTANAMAADRDSCLAAGMNDHIGKPFAIAELRDMLLRHIHAVQAGR